MKLRRDRTASPKFMDDTGKQDATIASDLKFVCIPFCCLGSVRILSARSGIGGSCIRGLSI
jgi:hypothetical protein